MSNKRIALQLLSQLIEMSQAIDAQEKKEDEDPSSPKGEGFFTFHLKKVQDLVETIQDDSGT